MHADTSSPTVQLPASPRTQWCTRGSRPALRLPNQLPPLAGAPPRAPARAPFEGDLGYGDEGPEVARLQEVLLAGRHLAGPQSVTGFFGRETKEGLQAWQARRGIPATGFFGPRSRKHINDRLKAPVPLALPKGVPGWAALRRRLPGGGAAAPGPRQSVRARGVAAGPPASSPLARRTGSPVASLGFGVLLGGVAFAFAILGRELLTPRGGGGGGGLARGVEAFGGLLEALAAWTRRPLGAAVSLLRGLPRPGRGAVLEGLEGLPLKPLGSPALVLEDAGSGGEAREPSGGERGWDKDDYAKRMELRRSNSSLKSRLAAVESELRSANWAARREGERASRAEALYLELKSELVAREKQLAELRTELRKRPPPRP